MTTTILDSEPVASADRQRRLERAVQAVRTRAAGADMARVLMITGGILLPLGVVFIILGWSGAAHTPYLAEQVPYLISGGLLGLGLVFAGGFLYFGYWLTQLVYAVRRETAATLDALERLQTVMAGGMVADHRDPIAAGATTYVATASGSMYHLPDCPVVVGRPGVRAVDPAKKGMTPCKICLGE